MEENSPQICNICKEFMSDPRILDCSHSFCLKCLETAAISKESPKCPTCQMDFQIPEGGLEDLKKNEFIEKLNRFSRSDIICDCCNDNQAIKYCVDCSFNYCSNCLLLHGKIPVSSNHVLQTVKLGESISSCEKHSEVITQVCLDCKEIICNQCLEFGHNNHKLENVVEYFKSTKNKIENKIKELEKTIANVGHSIEKCSVRTKDNEMKALKLKEEIQEKGENIKQIMDSIMNALIKKVDEEVTYLCHEADDIMKKLENMETIYKAQMESLSKQLNDLCYENMFELSPSNDCENDNIPKYHQTFSVSLCTEALNDDPKIHLQRMLGTLKKAPRFSLIWEHELSNSYSFFAWNQDGVYLSRTDNPTIDVLSFNKMNLESKYDLKDIITHVSDLLLINEKLYVSGFYIRYSNVTYIIITKIDLMLDCIPLIFYKSGENPNKVSNNLKLSRSVSGNILLIRSDIITLLSENGCVMGSFSLQYGICDVLQLDTKYYVVCCKDFGIRIIDEDGNEIQKFLSSNDCHKLDAPCLTKDDHGYIYVGGKDNILVFYQGLILKSIHSIHSFNERISKMFYHDKEELLYVLVHGASSRLLAFRL